MSKSMPDLGTGGLLAFLESLTPDEKAALIANLEEFHALVSSLRGEKLIETDNHLTEILILKRTPETERMEELAKKINPQGVKITYKTEQKPLKATRKKTPKNP